VYTRIGAIKINPMSAELSKNYDPAAVEAETYRVWLDEKCFEADPAKPGEPYSIVIPPPNVTGALHLGHAINNTLQDILTRVHRMRGFNTVWIPGIDHAGIATQAVVEKQLKEKENKTRHDVGRETLVSRIWEWKEKYGDRILSQLHRLGCSCDWSRTRFTLDDMCARAVRETFFKLFKDGLVYRGKRLVNWDTHLLTSISDDELYTETVKTSMWHIKYPIVDDAQRGTRLRPVPATQGVSESRSSQSQSHPHGPEAHVTGEMRASHMTVATTRPETLLADTAVAVHPDDPRWNWAVGKHVKLPLTNRLVPIIADPILVDMAFGSGVVKVTPAHDPNDYAVYTRHLGQPSEIAILNLMTPDGKVNDADPSWAAYTGLSFNAARKNVVEDLISGGFMTEADIKPHEANVNFSDRSKTAIQPYLSDQWFVKMAPLAEPALEVVRDGTIKFFPERHAQQYLSWLGEKRDWPISRQLWWGHRIPVWKLDFTLLPEFKLEDVKSFESLAMPRRKTIESALQKIFAHLGVGDRISWRWADDFVSLFVTPAAEDSESVLNRLIEWSYAKRALPNSPRPQTVCPPEISKYVDEVGALFAGAEQDPDVLDTWFSSALWPHSTLGWPEASADLARWYPTSVLMTGRDIITLWVARMVMMGMYNMGTAPRDTGFQPVPATLDVAKSQLSQEQNHPHGPEARVTMKRLGVPFAHVAINPTILDGKGERMSKSKGNGVDPVDIIDTHGADALRFTLTQMATETQDARMPVQAVCPHCGERFDNPESKAPVINCPKCKKPMTRPFENAAGTDESPLCRMTSKRFDEGRNFCNKLWNAGRFVLGNLESVSGMVGSPTMGTGGTGDMVAEATMPLNGLADQWIVSRFNRAVEDSNTALTAYRFDQYAKVCYDFFWRDFCDWYVEAAKPAMKDAARSAATANVLATMMDGILRLMHPMIPFITERLWWQLNEVRPTRNGTIPGKRLITAAWPTAGSINSSAEAMFTQLQEVIVAIRNVRNEYKLDPKKSVSVSMSVSGNLKAHISASRELIEVLGICTVGKIEMNLPMPANSARSIVGAIEVFVEGVIDPDAEKARAAKNREGLLKERDALIARLANPNYSDKAPAHLVQQTRDKLTAVEAELTKLDNL
jgi:valyl-tRNA synthetase